MGIEVRLGNTAELRNLLQSAAKREDIPQVTFFHPAEDHSCSTCINTGNLTAAGLAAERTRVSNLLGAAATGRLEAAGERGAVTEVMHLLTKASGGQCACKTESRWCRRRSGAHSKGPYLHQACQGGELLVASPSEREKSPELKARLAKLQKQLEAQQYAAMVKDITQKVMPAPACSPASAEGE